MRSELRAAMKPHGLTPIVNTSAREEVARWIAARVERDPQMRAAAQSHWPAPPELGDTSGTSDVLTVIRRDHNHFHKLASMFRAIPSAAQGATLRQVERRVAVVEAIRQSLPRHEAAEERAFWPFVRECWTGGAALADQAREQEHAADVTLAALAASDSGSDRFDELIDRLQRDLRVHVAFEDRVLLALTTSTSASDRARVGAELARNERSANGVA